MMTYAKLGTVSEGTLDTLELLEAFTSTLRDLLGGDADQDERIREAEALLGQDDDDPESFDQGNASDLLEDVTNALDEFAPPFSYFGTLEGDGAHYGFWFSHDQLREALDSGEAVQVNDLSEVTLYGISANGMRGEFKPINWNNVAHVVVVNDHGNVTVYPPPDIQFGKPILEVV